MKKVTLKERRKLILDLLGEDQNTSISVLSEKLNTQEATIRRDLNFLEQEKLIIRTHGGAILRKQPVSWRITDIHERFKEHNEEKQRIAVYVAQIIEENEVIMIDGSSTNLYIAQQLSKKENLTIVSNNSEIGDVLIYSKGFKIYLTGGELVRGANTMIGTIAEDTIKHFRADKAILSLNGVIPEEGYFCAIPQEAVIKKLMAQYSKETILVADSSKMGMRSFFFANDFSKVSTLVTGKEIKKDILRRFEANNINVVLV